MYNFSPEGIQRLDSTWFYLAPFYCIMMDATPVHAVSSGVILHTGFPHSPVLLFQSSLKDFGLLDITESRRVLT